MNSILKEEKEVLRVIMLHEFKQHGKAAEAY